MFLGALRAGTGGVHVLSLEALCVSWPARLCVFWLVFVVTDKIWRVFERAYEHVEDGAAIVLNEGVF